jgi:oligoendopeptidase F
MPAELLNAFNRLAPDKKAKPVEPAADLLQAEAELAALAAEGLSILASLDRSTDAAEAQMARFEAAVREEVRKGSRPDLSFAVEFMEQQERQIQRDYLPRLQAARKRLGEACELPPSARPHALALHRQQVATYTRLLQSTSDMKLRTLALRAMAEPPGDGPVFSDADELERSLDAL